MVVAYVALISIRFGRKGIQAYPAPSMSNRVKVDLGSCGLIHAMPSRSTIHHAGPSHDQLLTCSQAASVIETSRFAIWRWIKKGLATPRGERVHLRHERKGGQLFTTLGWIDEFHHELDLRSRAVQTPSSSTIRTRSRISDRVERRLGE